MRSEIRSFVFLLLVPFACSAESGPDNTTDPLETGPSGSSSSTASNTTTPVTPGPATTNVPTPMSTPSVTSPPASSPAMTPSNTGSAPPEPTSSEGPASGSGGGESGPDSTGPDNSGPQSSGGSAGTAPTAPEGTGGGAGGGEGGPDAMGGGAGAGGSDMGGGDPDDMVIPSPGCEAGGGRPSGGKVYNAGVSWLVFPEKYDGTTPLPVLWGWHGCGSYNFGDANRTEYWDETRNTPFEDEYVVAIPLAASADCFNYDTDIVRTKQLYDELTQNYCVDLNHMFGTGHSSGANFLHRMLQTEHAADWEYLGLRGIAPVASGTVDNHTSQVPVMYIHSPMESVNPDGPANNFISANGCGMETTPFDVGSCNSKDGGGAVNANCVSYGGCDVQTIFCPHNDPNYGGTYHGIPCFFYQGAYDFFESL